MGSLGMENRDVPVRRIESNRSEIRVVDSTTKVYLVLAAYIAAGLCGIRAQEELSWKDCRQFPMDLAAETRARLGILKKMLAGVEEAIQNLGTDY